MSPSPVDTSVLLRAAESPDHRLEFHRKLPTGGRHEMIDALLREGLIVETQDDYHLGDGALLNEDSATGLMLTTLALTDAGFHALNRDPPGTELAADTGATDAVSYTHLDVYKRQSPARSHRYLPGASGRATKH